MGDWSYHCNCIWQVGPGWGGSPILQHLAPRRRLLQHQGIPHRASRIWVRHSVSVVYYSKSLQCIVFSRRERTANRGYKLERGSKLAALVLNWNPSYFQWLSAYLRISSDYLAALVSICVSPVIFFNWKPSFQYLLPVFPVSENHHYLLICPLCDWYLNKNSFWHICP